jgi:hypothetical protein
MINLIWSITSGAPFLLYLIFCTISIVLEKYNFLYNKLSKPYMVRRKEDGFLAIKKKNVDYHH